MFITFEGFECSGKSTAKDYVSEMLKEQGVAHTVSREPGGTWIGGALRELLFMKADEMEPAVEAMLFYSDRIQHHMEVIKPALERGEVMISDRYYDSTLAYQGALGRAFPEKLHKFLKKTDLMETPDYTLLFDISLETYKARKKARGVVAGEEVNTFEDGRDDAYHDKVIKNFRRIAMKNPERYIVINANLGQEAVEQMVKHTISILLENER